MELRGKEWRPDGPGGRRFGVVVFLTLGGLGGFAARRGRAFGGRMVLSIYI